MFNLEPTKLMCALTLELVKELFSAAQQPRPTVTTEGVLFFFTPIGSRPYQNFGKKKFEKKKENKTV